jgi:hypothetical protein
MEPFNHGLGFRDEVYPGVIWRQWPEMERRKFTKTGRIRDERSLMSHPWIPQTVDFIAKKENGARSS